VQRFVVTSARLLTVSFALAWAAGCRESPHALFTDLMEARRLAADLQVQFTKAADASNRAVMADTDQFSAAYAREAEHFKTSVKLDVGALEPRLRNLGQPVATTSLETFGRQFAEYDKVDREALALAVENTNLKAQRLAFGPAREAADAFRDELKAAAAAAAAKERCRVDELVAAAVAAVREIQVIWGPHIAEREDAVMTRLEREMAALEAKARDAVAALAGLVDAKAKPSLARARATLDRFAGLSKEIVRLSRRNTNVASLDVALRRKPALTGACDESLRKLREALAKDPFPATR
jgi:hypothetical protein